MHYHLEVIMPPTDDIEVAIASILAPFDENADDNNHSFWDFYVIGGRYAGEKQQQKLDQEKVKQFYDWCSNEKITVSGLIAGKQELSPSSQIPKVDAKWNEMFPQEDGSFAACPLFKHSNDQYGKGINGTIAGDIGTLKNSLAISCERVIIAGPSFNHDAKDSENPYTGNLRAVFMLSDDSWNGVNHMPIAWDKTIKSAVDAFNKKADSYAETYKAALSPKDDWIVVTVDYHS
jgi:hypothetical protein